MAKLLRVLLPAPLRALLARLPQLSKLARKRRAWLPLLFSPCVPPPPLLVVLLPWWLACSSSTSGDNRCLFCCCCCCSCCLVEGGSGGWPLAARAGGPALLLPALDAVGGPSEGNPKASMANEALPAGATTVGRLPLFVGELSCPDRVRCR